MNTKPARKSNALIFLFLAGFLFGGCLPSGSGGEGVDPEILRDESAWDGLRRWISPSDYWREVEERLEGEQRAVRLRFREASGAFRSASRERRAALAELKSGEDAEIRAARQAIMADYAPRLTALREAADALKADLKKRSGWLKQVRKARHGNSA